MSYLFDWEWQYLTGSRFYNALNYYEISDVSFCHQWEVQIDFGHAGDVSDWGAHVTQPFESFMGLTPGKTVKTAFPENFYTAKLVAYDREPIGYCPKKDITNRDSSYVAREGTPLCYYREDDLSNEYCLYPRPNTIVWNEQDTQLSDPDFVYAYDWESTEHDGTGERFLRNDSTNSREYVFIWEDDMGADADYGMRGMFLFEVGETSSGQVGMVLYVEGDTTNTPVGTYVDRTKNLMSQESGIAIATIDDDDNILLIYDVNPTDLVDDRDESDFPVFLRKYIEYGVISRAYGANTDGRIQSLSDYWAYRRDTGMEIIKRFMAKRKQDRDYQLTTSSTPAGRTRQHPRLPSTYPAVG